MKRFALIIYAVALTAIFSCKSLQKSASSVKPMPAWAKAPQEDVTQIFYNAMREKLAGNLTNAIGLFNQVLHNEPNNAAAMFNLAQIYLTQSKYVEALQQINKAAQLDPGNVWYIRTQAEALIRNNKLAEAGTIYEKLIKQYPDNEEYYYSLITTLIFRSKPNEALKVYDRLEQQAGISPELCIQKEKLYIKLQKIDKAAEELQKLINAFPKEIQYYAMLADLYQANNLMDKALEVYKKMEVMDPDNAYLQLSLSDYYKNKGDSAKSFEALCKAFRNKELEIDTKFKILSSYWTLLQANPQLLAQAMELNRILVEVHPNVSAAHAFYGEFLNRDKKYEDARVEFLKAKNIDRKTFSIWQSLLSTELNLKDYTALSLDADSAIELFPNQSLVYYLSGIAKIQLKQYEKGTAVLSEGIKLVIDDKDLLAEFYANMGEAYFRQKKNKDSDESFDKALDVNPKNANTLNNYSYYLSLRADSLAKAERMSKLSNELEPENSYYEDTYGWILYKEGKYTEAKEWTEKAMKSRDGESGVIFEHYGDILYKLGDTENAYQYWLKAQKAGGASEFIGKKISEKKLFE